MANSEACRAPGSPLPRLSQAPRTTLNLPGMLSSAGPRSLVRPRGQSLGAEEIEWPFGERRLRHLQASGPDLSQAPCVLFFFPPLANLVPRGHMLGVRVLYDINISGVCLCVYVYMCTCVYVPVFARMCACLHLCMCAFVRACVCTHTNTQGTTLSPVLLP